MENSKDSYKSTTKINITQSATEQSNGGQSKTFHVNGIVPLRPNEYLPNKENSMTEWERYQMQVEFVNRRAHELEAAILELKQIASTLNIKEGLRFFPVTVPCIKQQPNNSLILTSRKVDLFRAEREAANIAQALRNKNYGIIDKNKV